MPHRAEGFVFFFVAEEPKMTPMTLFWGEDQRRRGQVGERNYNAEVGTKGLLPKSRSDIHPERCPTKTLMVWHRGIM